MSETLEQIALRVAIDCGLFGGLIDNEIPVSDCDRQILFARRLVDELGQQKPAAYERECAEGKMVTYIPDAVGDHTPLYLAPKVQP